MSSFYSFNYSSGNEYADYLSFEANKTTRVTNNLRVNSNLFVQTKDILAELIALSNNEYNVLNPSTIATSNLVYNIINPRLTQTSNYAYSNLTITYSNLVPVVTATSNQAFSNIPPLISSVGATATGTSNAYFSTWRTSNNILALNTSNNFRVGPFFVSHSNSNVGINTSNPTYLLDVNGSFRCSNLYVGDNPVDLITNVSTAFSFVNDRLNNVEGINKNVKDYFNNQIQTISTLNKSSLELIQYQQSNVRMYPSQAVFTSNEYRMLNVPPSSYDYNVLYQVGSANTAPFAASNDVFCAFDSDLTTTWRTKEVFDSNVWIGSTVGSSNSSVPINVAGGTIYFAAPDFYINLQTQVVLTSIQALFIGCTPTQHCILGSTDGVVYEIIYRGNVSSIPTQQVTQTFTFPNNQKAYKWYRYLVEAVSTYQGGTAHNVPLNIDSIRLFGYDIADVTNQIAYNVIRCTPSNDILCAMGIVSDSKSRRTIASFTSDSNIMNAYSPSNTKIRFDDDIWLSQGRQLYGYRANVRSLWWDAGFSSSYHPNSNHQLDTYANNLYNSLTSGATIIVPQLVRREVIDENGLIDYISCLKNKPDLKGLVDDFSGAVAGSVIGAGVFSFFAGVFTGFVYRGAPAPSVSIPNPTPTTTTTVDGVRPDTGTQGRQPGNGFERFRQWADNRRPRRAPRGVPFSSVIYNPIAADIETTMVPIPPPGQSVDVNLGLDLANQIVNNTILAQAGRPQI